MFDPINLTLTIGPLTLTLTRDNLAQIINSRCSWVGSTLVHCDRAGGFGPSRMKCYYVRALCGGTDHYTWLTKANHTRLLNSLKSAYITLRDATP